MMSVFVEVDGKRFLGDESQQHNGLELTLRETVCPGGKRYNLSLKNTGAQPVRVDGAGFLLNSPKSAGERQWRVFLDHGGPGWCGVKRLDALGPFSNLQPVREGEAGDRPFHRSDLQSVVWDAASGRAMLVGFLRQRHGENKVDIHPNHYATDIDYICAWQDFGLDIQPGAVQPLDDLVVTEGDDPYAMLEQFASAVMEHQGRGFDGPPIVGMMTWYGYRTAIDEDIILGNSKIIGELFDGYPQPMKKVMLLDHGWTEDANLGYWQPDEKRFSHGMNWLADRLAEDGLELGLWYTPCYITENAPNYRELLPLRAVDCRGNPIMGSASVWGQLLGHSSGRWPVSLFDGGLETVQEKWRTELARMKQWGTKYWKLDFSSLLTSECNRLKLGLGDLYARTWQNWRAVVGDESHMAPGSVGTNIQLGYSDSPRIGADIGNAGRWPGADNHYKFGMTTIAALWYKNRKFWVNDPDSIQIAKGCSLSEARVRATAVALSGGHLMLSEDLRWVDAERVEMIRRLIPPYPEAARPLDLFENPSPEGYPRFWALSLDTGFGPMTVLAVFNMTGETQTYEISPDMLGIEPGKEFLALEWWQCKWLGRFNAKFTVDVPAEDVAVIHARPVQDVPSLVSVSHHITGGYIVEDVSFDPIDGNLRGTLATKAGLNIVLFGQIPEGWGLSRKSKFHAVTNSIGGWQSEVTTTGPRTAFEVGFERV